MIFPYKSPQFENLKRRFENQIHKHSEYLDLSTETNDLIKAVLNILDSKNKKNLSILDSIDLKYHNWEKIGVALNDNALAEDNKCLYDFSKQEKPRASLVRKVIESIYIVLLADIYEASLITTVETHRSFFEQAVVSLQSYSYTLTHDSFNKLCYLWYIIPQEVFSRHLNRRLNSSVIQTINKLHEHQDLIKEENRKSILLKKDIAEIQETLNNQKSEYNFVGLSNGFRTLREQKKKELNWQNVAYYALMAVIISLIVSKSIWSANYLVSNNFDSPIFIIVTISTVLFLFILLYFFRISLVNVKSIKSQILQIDLRLTLCQFIHNYDSDTKDLREGMKESFERFESVIFSPIVATEDQMPVTFDGLEQLTGLLSSFNRSSK
ncbi:MAG: hypothetical protein ABS921_03370 [Psychrobacter alimentarius]